MGLFSLFRKKKDEDEFSFPSFEDSEQGIGDAGNSIPDLPPIHEREKDLVKPVPPMMFDSPSGSAGVPPPGSAPVSSFSSVTGAPPQQVQNSSVSSIDAKDVQLITAKLDLVKSSIDRLSERVDALEKRLEERTNIFKGRW